LLSSNSSSSVTGFRLRETLGTEEEHLDGQAASYELLDEAIREAVVA